MNSLTVEKNRVYIKDIGILKKYKEDTYKLIHMRCKRKKGFEEISHYKLTENDDEIEPNSNKKGSAGNTEKLQNSLSRTRTKIFELAICNKWEFFMTLTISKEKCNRYDLDLYIKKFGEWITNYNRIKKVKIQYLLIPEMHKDGAWHLHGLISGLPDNHLVIFNQNDKLPYYILNLINNGGNIYNWPAYARKFGFITLDHIRDPDSCAKYITKYITKDLIGTKIELNNHAYYCSKGLNRPIVVYEGKILTLFEPDFENDYVRIKVFNNMSDALNYFE